MICCSFGTQETKQLPFTLRVISTLTHSVVLFSTCVYIMASNNSENTHLRGDLGTKQSLAALLLWNSFPFGALICQVFLRSTEQGSLWSASLHVTYRPLSSLAFVLSWMHWSCLMCALRSGPLRSLFPACRRSPPSVCRHTHTQGHKPHIYTRWNPFTSTYAVRYYGRWSRRVLVTPPQSHAVSGCCRISIQGMKYSDASVHLCSLHRIVLTYEWL